MRAPSPSLIDDLKRRYGEPQRHYHTWEHIEALLGHYQTMVDQLNDPIATLWALYWHDAIYDPQAGDNEDKSADLLQDIDRKSTRLNSSHVKRSRMPSSA